MRVADDISAVTALCVKLTRQRFEHGFIAALVCDKQDHVAFVRRVRACQPLYTIPSVTESVWDSLLAYNLLDPLDCDSHHTYSIPTILCCDDAMWLL